MRPMMLVLGVAAMLLSVPPRVARGGDEVDEIEAKLQAIAKQQQGLEQEAQALRKQLEEVKKQSQGSIRIEIKGKLTALDKVPWYVVRVNDSVFPNVSVVVRLVRGEDKNRQLDEHLKSLAGKMVVVEGFLDCRSVGQAADTLDLYLRDVNQVKPLDEK
ncbi:MAG TPA: hypothetical protein VMS17_08635 [Gemmataceae bacterium]|nr:hypothetical protein [Gemmataceae bacterium]